jgi:mannosyltransferase
MSPPKTAVKQDAGDSLENSSSGPSWTLVSVFSLIFLAAAATALRFHFLTRKPFWFDECFSAVIARLSWHDFLRLLWWREANMALYYVLLRGWLNLDSGFSPFFIRSFSVLASLATLPAIFWLGSKLFDRRVGLIAVALISCNAYHIRYAQEARSYSLFVLLATLSSGFFVACVREPSPSGRDRWSYILASVLAVYAHLYALLLVAAQWLSVQGLERTQPSGESVVVSRVSRTLTSYASLRYASLRYTSLHQTWLRQTRLGQTRLRQTWIWIGVAILPLLAFVAKTGAGPIRWISRPSFHDLLDYWEHLAGNDGLPLLLLYAAACLAAILPLRASLFRLSVGWDVWRYQFLLVWLLFPVALALLLSPARPVFLARYFVFCLPALIILAAAGLANLRKTWMMAICLTALLLASLQGTFAYYARDFDLERDGSEAAASYIYDHARPGDAILFHIAEARTPYEFVRSLRTGSSQSSPEAGPDIIFPRHGDRLDYRDVTGKPTSEFMRSVPGQYARVWVMLMSNGAPGQPDATTLMLNQTLAESFPRVELVQFPEVEVRVYSRP